MKKILSLLIIPLPWFLKRLLYKLCFKYELHPTSHIGLSWIMLDSLSLAQGAKIGSLNVIKGLNKLQLDEFSSIGSLNWISAFPLNTNSPHFQHEAGERRPELVLGEHTAITNRHFLDCTNRLEIKRFSTFAGFKSTVLTHSIDLKECRQASKPITIGEYCFIGTGCILLGGSSIPDYSVLAAGSTLTKPMDTPYGLYGGTPAKFIKNLESEDLQYFKRSTGYVI
jgi:acetyltransferase-like isoleucine patch superfamily enzyme